MIKSTSFQYISEQEQLNHLAEKLAREPAVAVDLEADSLHHFEEKVCLIQLGTHSTCHIVDPLAVSDLSALGIMFREPDIVKIFHGADYDIRCLYRDFKITVKNLFDTELAARFLGYGATSLESVLGRHFNVTLNKKFQKKDWSMRPLPEDMIAYAADDVRYLTVLYEKMRASLKKKGRLDWLRQHCEDIAAVRPEHEPFEGPFFTKIKGAGRLDPKSLAVLEAMLSFRRRAAQKKDRPPFKILGNKTLLSLAQKKPKNAKELQKTGLLTQKQFHMYGEELLHQINAALSLPADKRPCYPKIKSEPLPASVTRRVKKLKIWRQQKAEALEIDPSLILNKNAMREVAEKKPETLDQIGDIKELKPWQKDMFGKELIRV